MNIRQHILNENDLQKTSLNFLKQLRKRILLELDFETTKKRVEKVSELNEIIIKLENFKIK